jgi:hypothetical protein
LKAQDFTYFLVQVKNHGTSISKPDVSKCHEGMSNKFFEFLPDSKALISCFIQIGTGKVSSKVAPVEFCEYKAVKSREKISVIGESISQLSISPTGDLNGSRKRTQEEMLLDQTNFANEKSESVSSTDIKHLRLNISSISMVPAITPEILKILEEIREINTFADSILTQYDKRIFENDSAIACSFLAAKLESTCCSPSAPIVYKGEEGKNEAYFSTANTLILPKSLCKELGKWGHGR